MINIKKIVLAFVLIVLVLLGSFVTKIFDVLLDLKYENIWIVGFKTGFNFVDCR